MSELKHYGTPRHSGRYPWGSGKNPQRNKNFYSRVRDLESKGMSEKDIAKGFGMTIDQLRARKSIATNELKKENIDRAVKLKEKGYSNVKIAEMMGTTESNIRNWIKPGASEKRDSISSLASVLKEQVDTKGYIDIGKGVELSLNASQSKMKAAVEILKEQGYFQTNVQVNQQGTKNGQKTLIKVLAPPGTTYKDIRDNKDKIRSIEEYDQGDIKENKFGLPPIKSINSDRIKVVYGEQGGTDKDGVIEIRPGLKDLNLGNANYAQVRIAVDGTHYLKGMAIYSDKIPEGYDVIFNTNKSEKKGKLGVMKELARDKNGNIDMENPFAASIKTKDELKRVPRYYTDENGKEQVSPINVVNEEGDWAKWSKTLASQMLSKQPMTLVKRQLSLTYDIKKAELDEIRALDNPIVKKKMLESYANDMDASAVHLKAAALPGQASHVILPLPNIKENEIFAPKYENGTQVALVRFPHGGTFEIPILTVNNNNKDGKKYIGTDSPDAVGIHPRAAERLSGADFDGDTALVIPTGGNINIKSTKLLDGLKGFDPKKEYALDRDNPEQSVKKIPPLTERYKQIQMGVVTNLITDMTIKGASPEEIAMATRHSMVIIDAVKHDLDYRRSAKENHIDELEKIYQIRPDGSSGGASTLISRAKSEKRVNTRKEKGWDKETGEVIYEDKPEDTYPVRNKEGEVIGVKRRQEKTTQMAYTNDARTLISDFNTPVERAYAEYANNLKALANEARKEYMATSNPKRDPEAAKEYSAEVASLRSKLNIAKKNSPRERQAQLIADQTIEMMKANGEIGDDDKESKLRAKALNNARLRVGAKKETVTFTPKEWEAVQNHAISSSMLTELLNNANMDDVKKLATPRSQRSLRTSQIALAKSMLARGYTLEEVGNQFGVSPSTISNAIST